MDQAHLIAELEGALASIRRDHDGMRQQQEDLLRQYGAAVSGEIVGSLEWLDELIEVARVHLPARLQDPSGTSPEDLVSLAAKLSPGGAHTGGWFALELIGLGLSWQVDPHLLAAMIAYNWSGGKAGFQFLPDPAQVDADIYESDAYCLLELLDAGGAPHSVLTGKDRQFFDSLPERLTVYRGASGIDADMAARGLCWTTNRRMAEWFAVRLADPDAGKMPVVVSARCRKDAVRLVNAAEREVVVAPWRVRQIKCRRTSMFTRPEFD